jgi:hypothetical protein
MDLVCDQVREAGHWLSSLPLEAPWEEVGGILRERLAAVDLGAVCPRLDFEYLGWPETSLIPILKPSDAKSEEDLRTLREETSRRTGVCHAGHLEYGFHITVAYRLNALQSSEESALQDLVLCWKKRLKEEFGCLELGAPELVAFPDMTRFVSWKPGTRLP